MTEEPIGQGERSLVRIGKSDRGRTWSVSVRAGDQLADLEEALAIAEEIERRLSRSPAGEAARPTVARPADHGRRG